MPKLFRKGHSTDECKTPKVELDHRKCFLCKKPGHRAFQCPDTPARPVAAVGDAAPKTATIFCVEDSEGLVPIQRREGAVRFLVNWLGPRM